MTINLIILASSTLSSILTIKKLTNLRKESYKNKHLFVNEFKKSELNQHKYMSENYIRIKRYIQSKYKILNYLEKEDELFTKCIYREDKDSYKYQLAVVSKYDIRKVREEIEFDVLRECFINIYKYEEKYHNGQFLINNKNLILYFTKSLSFSREILLASRFLFISSFVVILSLVSLFY